MRVFAVLVVTVMLAVTAILIFGTHSSRIPAAASLSTKDITATAASENGADIPFVQGGTIALELQAADYKLVPSDDDHITIAYRTNPYNTQQTKIAAGAKGSNANIRIETPSGNGIHVEIGVPAKTNLYLRLTAGNLVVTGIEGSKDIEARAGNVSVDVIDANQYGPVYGSVSSGNLSAAPWSVHKGGLMRSFTTKGSGGYGLHAHVGAGNLMLTENSAMK